MPLKHIFTVAPLLALFTVPNLADTVVIPHSGSLQMIMIVNAALSPVGNTQAPDRTTRGLLLAEDRKKDHATDRPHSPDPASPPEPPDDSSNRDLERPQRASPEAANDLFQLLKQAGPKQGSKPK